MIIPVDSKASVLNLIYGHYRFIQNNTGITNDPKQQHYVENPDGLLSNNRHFIADTQMEYQPNGDATTEGQSVHILGYCYAYRATGDLRFLRAAEHAWDAYVKYFYVGQSIPNDPQRWICNWIANGKEPCLSNWPINPVEPTQGGYKCVPLQFTNGRAQIPHGSPFWGEYLDVASFAHRGHMVWDSINGSVIPIGNTIDWDEVYRHRVTDMPNVPWSSKSWIDWDGYLGANNYTVDWSVPYASTLQIEWLIAWTHNKIGILRGPHDQIWSGEILETDIDDSQLGTIQLTNNTINGVYLLNYAVRLPVEHGGYRFDRNEVWHNRPIHTPLLGSINQLGNAADAELWFVDACLMMYELTGETKYKKAMDCALFTSIEYTSIDSTDKFFRRSNKSTTPFTDGISYDFSYPSNTQITYERDIDGYIRFVTNRGCQHFLEQQTVWFRVDNNSSIRVTYGGRGDTNEIVGCKIMLDISKTKQPTSNDPNWYGFTLPKVNTLVPIQYDVPIISLAQLNNPNTNDDYLVADARAVTDYGGCTWSEEFESNVYDGRSATVISSVFPNDQAGLIIGFWLSKQGLVNPLQIVYKSDGDFNLRISDINNWRWWWMLPNTNQQWNIVTLTPNTAHLSGYQPDHTDTEIPPDSFVPNPVNQITILLDGDTTNNHFSYYVINDIPPLYDTQDGWTMTYRMVMSCSEPFVGLVGDCTVVKFRDDSLAYCPGVIPFSNIYSEGSEQIGAWHGMPYPGYQYPLIYCFDLVKYGRHLSNMINFLYDSQQWYANHIGELGPVASAYVWNRWDNYKYGTPDTFTQYHWGDGTAWSGYQPRAFFGAARAWHYLIQHNQEIPWKLQLYVENWIDWLMLYTNRSGGMFPTDFPPNSRSEPIPGDFTGHMSGLWLAGMCLALMSGCQIPGLRNLIELCVNEINDSYVITDLPNHPMNGSWSPAVRVETDNGMFFGFWAGELLRGLSLYVTLDR